MKLFSVTFDAADPPRLADFWAQLTGYSVRFSDENIAQITGDGSVGPMLMFLKVPESKTAKNRMHVDLGTADLDTDVDRAIGLGAELIDRHQECGVTWATLRDPEGNEFCIGLHP